MLAAHEELGVAFTGQDGMGAFAGGPLVFHELEDQVGEGDGFAFHPVALDLVVLLIGNDHVLHPLLHEGHRVFQGVLQVGDHIAVIDVLIRLILEEAVEVVQGIRVVEIAGHGLVILVHDIDEVRVVAALGQVLSELPGVVLIGAAGADDLQVLLGKVPDEVAVVAHVGIVDAVTGAVPGAAHADDPVEKHPVFQGSRVIDGADEAELVNGVIHVGIPLAGVGILLGADIEVRSAPLLPDPEIAHAGAPGGADPGGMDIIKKHHITGVADPGLGKLVQHIHKASVPGGADADAVADAAVLHEHGAVFTGDGHAEEPVLHALQLLHQGLSGDGAIALFDFVLAGGLGLDAALFLHINDGGAAVIREGGNTGQDHSQGQDQGNQLFQVGSSPFSKMYTFQESTYRPAWYHSRAVFVNENRQSGRPGGVICGCRPGRSRCGRRCFRSGNPPGPAPCGNPPW